MRGNLRSTLADVEVGQPASAAISAAEDRRRLDVQGLRAVAVLMVVAYHAGLPIPGGFVGVDVFFVISGFVIAAMLQREWRATGRIDFKNFYLRRFKRLTPALSLVVAVTLICAAFLLSPLGTQQATAKTAIGAVLLASNLVIARTTGGYFDAPAETNPLLHCWSLSVEEQFYLVFPALLFLGWSIGRQRRPRGTGAFALTSLSVVSLVSLGFAMASALDVKLPIANYLYGFYSPMSRTWEFGVGALLALRGTNMSVSRARSSSLGLAGLAMLVASLFLITGSSPFPGPWTILPVVGTAFLLIAGADGGNFVSKLFSTAPFVKLGDWSYSVYLWHWPFIVFAGILWPDDQLARAGAALLSIGPSVASYRGVEQPLREMSLPDKRRVLAAVLCTLLPPMVLAALLVFASRRFLETPEVATAASALSAQHTPSERGCMTRGPFDQGLGPKCWWNQEAAGTPIYLVGDSNAWQFAEAVLGAAKSLGRPAWILTAPSCPFIDGLKVTTRGRSSYFPGPWPATEFAHCSAYARYTLDWLADARPGTVVIAGLDQYWWDPSILVALDNGPASSEVGDKARVLRDGLSATAARLVARRHRILLVQAIPTFRNPRPTWDPRSCTNLSVLQGRCVREVPIDIVDGIQSLSRVAVKDAAQQTGSSVLDLRNHLCPGSRCSTHRSGAWVYMDATHLTVNASRELAGLFESAILAASE